MAKKLFFNEYSDLMQENFKDTKDIKTFGKICIDTYKNQLQGQSVAQANTVIRNKICEIAGLPENPTQLQIKRAFRKGSVKEAIFEIIEETLDNTLTTASKLGTNAGSTTHPVYFANGVPVEANVSTNFLVNGDATLVLNGGSSV